MNFKVNIDLCRVCMKSGTGTSMFIDESLQSKFEFVTHLRVERDDNLPAIICEKCILLLNLSYKFIQSAQETEKNLKTFLAKINNDFKLVTKATSPAKTDITDDVEGMLELLSGTEVTQQDNSLKNSKESAPKTTSTKTFDNKKRSEKAKKYDSDVEEMSSFEEIYSPKPLTINTTDDDESRNVVDEKNEQLRGQVTHYIEEFTDESSHIIEYNHLEDMLMTEEENSQLVTENKEQQANKDGYLEDYEALIEDETSTMDILYEDNENDFEANVLQQTSNSSFAVETIVMEPQNRNEIQDGNVVSSLNKAEKTQKVLEESRKRSSKSGSMRKINSTVTESTRFYCSKCNRDFSTRTNLTRHVQLHDGKRPYKCNICSRGFSQNGTLKQHMFTHTGEKPHVCKVCNRGFTQSKSLVFHLRRHTGDKPHQCDYCGSLFRQKDALKVHILKHHTDIGDRAFSCKICNKEMTAHELRSHMKRHLNNHKTIIVDSNGMIEGVDENDLNLGESMFLPDELSLDVEGSTHVIDIMATSTTEPSRAKKYQCRTCFKCFAIKKNLIRHLSFHDIPTSSLQQCQICDLVFDTNYALKVHRVREHKEININLNECDDCQVKFQNAEELSIHMQNLHTFSCSLCPGVFFSSKQQFHDHLLEHNIDEIEEDE